MSTRSLSRLKDHLFAYLYGVIKKKDQTTQPNAAYQAGSAWQFSQFTCTVNCLSALDYELCGSRKKGVPLLGQVCYESSETKGKQGWEAGKRLFFTALCSPSLGTPRCALSGHGTCPLSLGCAPGSRSLAQRTLSWAPRALAGSHSECWRKKNPCASSRGKGKQPFWNKILFLLNRCDFRRNHFTTAWPNGVASV